MKKKAEKKKNEKLRILRISLVAVFLVGLLIVFYYYISHRTEGKSGEDAVVITQTQKVLSRNLETFYPPSPREVVKYYSEITQCFYNEEHSEDELYELAMKIRKLYAEDLVANQTEEDYLSSLKSDIASMKKNNCVVSSYSPSASTDVDFYTEDGREWARLYCVYNIRQGTTLLTSNEVFLLQKDEEGHWKIYGWKLVEE